MNNSSNPLTADNSSQIAAGNMPVSSASPAFNPVLRMPVLQEFHSLPSLSLPAYGSDVDQTPTQRSYFYHDNGYGVPLTTLPCIKEEKLSNSINERSCSPVDTKPSLEDIQARLSTAASSKPPSSDSFGEMEDVTERKPKIKLEVVDDSDVIRTRLMNSSPYHSRHHALAPTNKIVTNPATNMMMVRSSHMLSNHQPILRFPSSNDSLLGVTNVSYNEHDMLPEGGFNVSVNAPLGSIIGMNTSGSGGSTDSGAYDLFENERRQENFNQDLQLSPAGYSNSAETYGLNENSNHEQMIDESGINEEASIQKVNEDDKRIILNSNVAINKQKNKCRPVKSGSPNRTGTLPCPVCSKIFSNSSALAKHKLTHSDERKYVCQLCTKAFKRQDHLNGHLLTHMNKKPYECKVEGCGKSYCDARSLRRHTENHHAAMAQANAAAAAAAAVNAIAIRMGTSNVENESNNNSFLAAALQSNRIRYAPPPAAATTTSVSMARSSPTPVTATFSNDHGGNVTSAATQLQLLAFQQSASASQDASSSSSSAPSWHQQQNVLFINNSLGQGTYGDVGENSSNNKEEKNLIITSAVSMAPCHETEERSQSVLERHLKMTVNTAKEKTGQENAPSTTISSNEILTQSQSPILQSLHSLPFTSQALPIMAFHLKNQWPQGSNFGSGLDFSCDPKPVECNICQRRFKNIPALNGHMRLHGGYLKRDADGLKKGQDKKPDLTSSTFTSTSSSQSPLQTASINVRALIEEKIIQKRIVNPSLPPANPPLPPPPPLFVNLPPPSMPSVLNTLPPEPLAQSISTSNYMTIPEIIDSDNVSDGLLSYESSDDHSVLPSSPNLPPPPPPHSQSNRSNLIQDSSSIEEDAQTSMQRQIEIIKQGLMSHQPVIEKFRRHSDSDHFLAPDRSSYHDLYDLSSSSSFMDYMRQKIACKRTQRTGSDPGEFAMGSQLNEMFSEDLEIGELTTGEDDINGGIQPSDMMDFEMVEHSSDHDSKNNNTSLLAAALCSTPTSNLMDVIEGIPSPFNDQLVMPESADPQPLENSFKNVDMTEDDDVFLSPSSISNSPIINKKKHRPEPLHIPPHVSTCGYQSRLRSPRLWDPQLSGKIMSPPPYTPPPMLSPVRSGPGLFWHVLSGSGSITPKSAPITPGKITNTVDMVPNAFEESNESYNEPPPETDIKPHVNIGIHYQARVPRLRIGIRPDEPDMADIVWDPKLGEALSEKDLEHYMGFACCAAVPGGGRNKEYAMHILHMANGNIQDAMLKLMEPTPRLPKRHPLFTYTYAETDKWTTEEIECYQQALLFCDKDFNSIAQEVKTKSVRQCVQFYYLWKTICPDEYKKLRNARRRREPDSNYNLRSKLDDADEGIDLEQSNTPKSDDRVSSPGQPVELEGERFVCDHPDCFASFSTRQALNGHARIHGGNPILTRLVGRDDLLTQPYSPSTNSVSNASTHAENVEEFPCKLCPRVFSKVKSRNAHMKSHRPLDSDRHK